MKNFYGIIIVLILLVGCSSLESSNSLELEGFDQVDQPESTFKYELTDPDFNSKESEDFRNLTQKPEEDEPIITSERDLDKPEDVIIDHQLSEAIEPIEDEDYTSVDDTMTLTNFSKTIQVGEDESVITSFYEDVDYYSKSEMGAYTQHIISPVSFLTSGGIVQLIGWGRTGLYDEWKTAEGIGRTSTIESAKKAYQNYEYELLYREGLALPSYMLIEYNEDLLVLEFSAGEVSLIFRCAPEMIESLPVINYYFTPDHLENNPF